jgi:preprotein translocase subunit SecG
VDYLLGFLNLVIVVLTLFLIVLILIQRGKGGGLAGAFGGMGGSSAFGARTGDVFTKVTVGVAMAWILLSMVLVVLTNRKPKSDWVDGAPAAVADSEPGRDGKNKLKDTTTSEAGSSKLPRPSGSSLPADVKDFTELPDALEGPILPTKPKNSP